MAIKINPEVEKRRDDLLARRICLGCERPIAEGKRVKLGQCPACYQHTRRAIAAKKADMRRLMREGKVAQRKKGRPPNNPYIDYLAEL